MADDQDLPAATGDTRESALRPAGSDLHPADHPDDLTGNTPGADDTSDDGWPADDAADGDRLADELPDTLPGDSAPGDGTVEAPGSTETPDAMRTAEHGRESQDAAKITSDSAPQPTETPVD
jgi:hypothetical protein